MNQLIQPREAITRVQLSIADDVDHDEELMTRHAQQLLAERWRRKPEL